MQILAGCFAVMLLGVLAEWEWIRVYTDDLDGVVGILAGVGAASAWMVSQKPMAAPYTAETLTAVSGVGVAFLFVTGRLGFSADPISVSALALLSVGALTLQVAIALSKAEALRLQPTDDATLALALCGAVAIGLSLFGLAWFTFDGFVDLSVKFRDFVDAYREEVTYSGSVAGIRLLYFEGGYVLSLILALAVAGVSVRGRKQPLPASVPVKWLVIGLTALVGVWQLVLVIGLGTIEDGSVGFGAWLGVIGHVLVIAATLRLANIKLAKAASLSA